MLSGPRRQHLACCRRALFVHAGSTLQATDADSSHSTMCVSLAVPVYLPLDATFVALALVKSATGFVPLPLLRMWALGTLAQAVRKQVTGSMEVHHRLAQCMIIHALLPGGVGFSSLCVLQFLTHEVLLTSKRFARVPPLVRRTPNLLSHSLAPWGSMHSQRSTSVQCTVTYNIVMSCVWLQEYLHHVLPVLGERGASVHAVMCWLSFVPAPLAVPVSRRPHPPRRTLCLPIPPR